MKTVVNRYRLLGWISYCAAVIVPYSDAHTAVINADPSNYEALRDTLQPGDTLRLAPGLYPLLYLRNLNGTTDAWITVEGPETGAPTIVNPDPKNPFCCNLIEISNSSYLALRNVTIDSAGTDAIFGINSSSINHDILIENCTFVGQDSHQQTVAISTKGTDWNWTIRGNTIIRAGTGMYLGNSDGGAPFINGVIEGNLIVDTIGYNVQIKHQNPYSLESGVPPGPHTTIIRDNVFIKEKAQSGWPADRLSGARPSLLVGGFPNTGENAQDRYEIYGNFFYKNPDESLFQGSGRVFIHDNIFVGGSGTSINLRNHDLPLKVAYVYNNTIYGGNRGIFVSDESALESLAIRGNVVFSASGISGPGQSDNVEDTVANAVNYVIKPSLDLGSMDFYPLPGALQGPPLDLSAFEGHSDFGLDFNKNSKGDFSYRGAYAGESTNPGWRLEAEKKDIGSSHPPNTTRPEPPTDTTAE
jgi:hypothetical protein